MQKNETTTAVKNLALDVRLLTALQVLQVLQVTTPRPPSSIHTREFSPNEPEAFEHVRQVSFFFVVSLLYLGFTS